LLSIKSSRKDVQKEGVRQKEILESGGSLEDIKSTLEQAKGASGKK
jgi:hypothetical protein